MSSSIAILTGFAPMALILTAGVAHTGRASLALVSARVAAAFGLVVAVGSSVAVTVLGPLQSPLVGAFGWGLRIRLDPLSVTLMLLVSLVGVVVVRFSRNYLSGDPRHAAFTRDLVLTLASVQVLVLAGNLGQLVLAWSSTSLCLHRLLLFYRERPRAILAARKKFIVARGADVTLASAAIFLAWTFSSADIAVISEAARTLDSSSAAVPGAVTLAAVLLVVAACFKSAQFPTHGWLIDVMETPTPVSALLHAGLINAGGFLILRFADVMSLVPAALVALAVVGTITAVFGALATLCQTRVKTSLAYSTVAQMGFMMLQCGLGAYMSALIHLVAHSLYKAHAFLSSGSVLQKSAISTLHPPRTDRSVARLAGAMVASLAIFVGVGWTLGFSIDEKPGVFVLGAVVSLGLAHLLADASRFGRGASNLWRACGWVLGIAVAYFALQHAAVVVYASTFSLSSAPAGSKVVGALALLAFAAIVLAQWLPARARTSGRWRAAHVHLKHGLYVNSLFDRFVSSSNPARPVR